MSPAPIALFAYNRPDHLRQTVNALQSNPLASHSTLFIFCDGAKGAHDAAAVEEVRNLARNVTAFGRVHVREQTTNRGLAQSVIAGVSEVVSEFGAVIVLEDDLVVAPGFLTYMNHALEQYRDNSQVMQVSGYMFPVAQPQHLSETFFCRVPTSWGWGTWARAWKQLNLDSAWLLEHIHQLNQRETFNVNGAYSYFEHLRLQAEGKLDVWGVRWYASMFVVGGVCLYPRGSLVQNIGLDGSGVHCGVSSRFDVSLSPLGTWKFPDHIEESPAALEAIRAFLLGLRAQQQPSGIAELVSRLRAAAGRMKRAVLSSAG